ncbi:MAG: hypothetical protein RL028_564 [Actinomycetota bacterium]|jgi:hypothetical protein
MRRVAASFLVVLLLATGGQPVSAEEFVRISGKITTPPGVVLDYASVVVSNGQYSASANSAGNYEVVVPKGVSLQFVFLTTVRSEGVAREKAQPTFANWKTLVTFQESRTLDFSLPKPNRVRIRFVDAQDQPLTLVKLGELDGNEQHDPISQSGFTWTGLHRLSEPVNRPGWGAWSETGSLDILLFDDLQHQGFSHSGFEFDGKGKNTGPGFTSKFRVTPDMDMKLCHLVNFGSSLTLPPGCFMTRAEQQASPTPTPTPTPTKTASPAPKPVKYKNCTALNAVYPEGVAKSASSKNKGGKIRLKQVVNAKVYELNKALDRDKDGLACER